MARYLLSGCVEAKMNVAVPVWEGRVSPLFDTAQRILLAETFDSRIRCQKVLELPNQTFKECVGFLCNQKVRVLICGAISQPLSRMVGTGGIILIPWVAGGVEEVISAYLTGCL
ncbi:MAG: NifB/NifX family molybdenum-iron cluster-binding protein, partial [Chlorobiales bacterium]|nr:NifB/NifX family molybdenum-iron cluster-binding protein [Chlorobiales bacterium]